MLPASGLSEPVHDARRPRTPCSRPRRAGWVRGSSTGATRDEVRAVGAVGSASVTARRASCGVAAVSFGALSRRCGWWPAWPWWSASRRSGAVSVAGVTLGFVDAVSESFDGAAGLGLALLARWSVPDRAVGVGSAAGSGSSAPSAPRSRWARASASVVGSAAAVPVEEPVLVCALTMPDGTVVDVWWPVVVPDGVPVGPGGRGVGGARSGGGAAARSSVSRRVRPGGARARRRRSAGRLSSRWLRRRVR